MTEWRHTIAQFVDRLGPHMIPMAMPEDDGLGAISRELAADAVAEEITADARFEAWRRTHG